jgi:hypothetical protein
MENLKISFFLNSPLLIGRFSTIDSILVNLYVKRHFGKNIEIEKLYDFDFIEKYKDGYCGSIWFVEENDQVSLENRCIVKKPEYEYLNENRANKIEYSMGSGEFKAYNIWNELLKTPKIYFYVRGKREIIEDLLQDLKFIGKKTAIGYGQVSSFLVETIPEDKSVFLAKNTPARPISVKNYPSLENARIIYYNSKVPYWANWSKEACYMPNSSLTETIYPGKERPSIDEKYLSKYHSAINFVYDVLHEDKNNWQEIDLKEKATAKDLIVDGQDHLCAFSGEQSKEGILCKSIEKTLGSTFTDYAFLNKSKFVSKQTFWTLQCGVNSRVGKKSLGFHVVDKNGITYVMGKNKTKSIEQAIKDASLPFNLALKTTPNNQHVVFKSNLTLSKDLIACQYGSETYYFGYEEAKECLKRVNEIIKDYPITKSHLIPNPQIDAPFISLKKDARNKDTILLISDFYKQYSKDVRVGAYILTIGEK